MIIDEVRLEKTRNQHETERMTRSSKVITDLSCFDDIREWQSQSRQAHLLITIPHDGWVHA